MMHGMNESTTIRALGALAQPQRLRAFRSLVQAGPEGLTPGALSAQLGVTPSALSFHLKELTHAGLIEPEPRGRNLIYRASFQRMNELMAYLTEHCCRGERCELATAQACDSPVTGANA
jgi:ArsR family transcriptional regulator, arsenate/arsenite/antimonite-responsive transcriptional repressor